MGDQLARPPLDLGKNILPAQSHNFVRSPGTSVPMIVGKRVGMKVTITEPGDPLAATSDASDTNAREGPMFNCFNAVWIVAREKPDALLTRVMPAEPRDHASAARRSCRCLSSRQGRILANFRSSS